MEAMRSITGSIGCSRAFLRRFYKCKSIAAGYTADWPTARTSGFASTDVGIKSEIYRNNQHEMLVSAGLLVGHRSLRLAGRRSRRAQFYSARRVLRKRGLAIYPTGSRGYGLSPSPARSWTNCRSERRQLRLVSVRRAVRLKASLFQLSKRFTGACPFNTAHIT